MAHFEQKIEIGTNEIPFKINCESIINGCCCIFTGDTVRCIGQFIGDTQRFRIEKLSIVSDPVRHQAIIGRLTAISNYTIKE